jgi:hypothetical protein
MSQPAQQRAESGRSQRPSFRAGTDGSVTPQRGILTWPNASKQK